MKNIKLKSLCLFYKHISILDGMYDLSAMKDEQLWLSWQRRHSGVILLPLFPPLHNFFFNVASCSVIIIPQLSPFQFIVLIWLLIGGFLCQIVFSWRVHGCCVNYLSILHRFFCNKCAFRSENSAYFLHVMEMNLSFIFKPFSLFTEFFTPDSTISPAWGVCLPYLFIFE